MIFHVLRRADWQRARATGEIGTGGFQFVHLCTGVQLRGVVDRYFNGAEYLVALAVDEAKFGDRLRWEPGVDPESARRADDGELFPHLYGPLPLDLVEAAHDLRPDGQLGERLP
jgi:uncharacterized protein (DUF952 family)